MDKIKRALRAARPKYQDGGSLPFVSIPAGDLAKAQADPYRYERFFEPVATAVKSLGDLVKAPFDMARDARQAGGYSQLDPTDVGRAGLNTGLGTLMPAVGGVGGRGGAVLMSGAGPTDKKGITAYHGSPHDFDKFDMSKIGTGEGAQAYGHGLYFADSEGVAKWYRDGLTPASLTYEGKAVTRMPTDEFEALPIERRQALNWLRRQSKLEDVPVNMEIDNLPDTIKREIQTLIDDGKVKPPTPGRLYEVRIDADPEDFLDWDKPLSQQSEKVRGLLQHPAVKRQAEFFNDPAGEKLTGKSAYGAVAKWNTAGSQRAGSGDPTPLREAGIPGIKYLDQGSRAAGEGSRNYVLFRDDIINIVRKYGMAAAVSMYGADAVNNALQPMATGNDG